MSKFLSYFRREEKAKSEIVFFSATNLKKPIIRMYEIFEDENERVNATLVEVNSNNPNLSGNSIFSNFQRKGLPFFVFDADSRFISYFPYDIISDKHNWGSNLTTQEHRELLQEEVKSRINKPVSTSFKPTLRSAVQKSKELRTIVASDGKNKSDLVKRSAIERGDAYFYIDGNKIAEEKRVITLDKKNLEHNECHIKPSYHNIRSIGITKEVFESDDQEEKNKDFDDDILISRSTSILRAITLIEELQEKRQEILADPEQRADLVEFEKRKAQHLQNEIKYFEAEREILLLVLAEIDKIKDEDFDVNKLQDTKLKEALLRKNEKIKDFAVTGKYGKRNALNWIGRNLTKISSYIQDLNEEIKNCPVNTEKYVRDKLSIPIAFEIYDADQTVLKRLDEYETQALKIHAIQACINKTRQGSNSLLYELFSVQLPYELILKILNGTRSDDVKRMMQYTGKVIFEDEEKNILENYRLLMLAIRARDLGLINLSLDIINKYLPVKEKKPLILIVFAIMNHGNNLGMIKDKEILEYFLKLSLNKKPENLPIAEYLNNYNQFLKCVSPKIREYALNKIVNIFIDNKIDENLIEEFKEKIDDSKIQKRIKQLKCSDMVIDLDTADIEFTYKVLKSVKKLPEEQRPKFHFIVDSDGSQNDQTIVGILRELDYKPKKDAKTYTKNDKIDKLETSLQVDNLNGSSCAVFTNLPPEQIKQIKQLNSIKYLMNKFDSQNFYSQTRKKSPTPVFENPTALQIRSSGAAHLLS